MECQPIATIPEVLAKVDLFQAFRTLFLLVYKVANSVYYYYLPASQLRRPFFLHLCHQNTIAWVCSYCRWTRTSRWAWIRNGQKESGHAGLTDTRSSGVLRQLDEETRSHHKQLNIKSDKNYKLKRKTRIFTLDWMYSWYCVLRESHCIPYMHCK